MPGGWMVLYDELLENNANDADDKRGNKDECSVDESMINSSNSPSFLTKPMIIS
jgi:hypothetical protein